MPLRGEVVAFEQPAPLPFRRGAVGLAVDLDGDPWATGGYALTPRFWLTGAVGPKDREAIVGFSFQF